MVVPGNKKSFPPAFAHESRLHYYASMFNTVEINSSFYKIPMPVTFEKWAKDVPGDFRFSVKLWKDITHQKSLSVDIADIHRFLQAADQLGKKSGCLLVQFPGKISVAYYNEVESILAAIHERDYRWRTAVEFRNKDWYISETFDMLDQYKASIVLHDIPKSKNHDINKKASFMYIRFHGPAGDYRGTYSGQALAQYVETIKAFIRKGKDVYVYFNNTIGDAFDNAQLLRKMLAES